MFIFENNSKNKTKKQDIGQKTTTTTTAVEIY
jgi:hypothetical protein